MGNYSIKDLEKLSGIKAHTIRIWEKRYGLVEPNRTDTNIRLYCDKDLKKLLNISMLNRNGYKISKIAGLTENELNEKIITITQNPGDTQSQIENLTIAMIELDELKFEKILSRSIIQMGFENTMMRVIYPLFIKIGVMWQIGTITPAQEHFISNLVRQKFIVAIDSQVNQPKIGAKTFLMYLPEGELHELGLLFSTYLARKREHKVIYLGQTVPFNDLSDIIKKHSIDYICTSFYTFDSAERRKWVETMNNAYPERQVLILGGQSKELINNVPSNFKLFHTPESFASFLDTQIN